MKNLNDWRIIAVSPKDSILRVMQIIDHNQTRFAIVWQNEQLLGTVSDGDIRRAILSGLSTDLAVESAMNKNPITAQASMTKDEIIKLMITSEVSIIPIIDENNRVVNLLNLQELKQTKLRDNPVIIMAGGLGKRLGDLTTNCPKPLLKVNEKPVLEHLIENCKFHGLNQFHIAVNYLSHQIEQYFEDGAKWGVNISYIREEKKLGTAGALSLLESNSDSPLLVMNGDLMTKVSFTDLLELHTKENNKATMCVRNYQVQIPYGVIKTKFNKVLSIEEKPVNDYYINAGIYVINKEELKKVPRDKYFEMTTFFTTLISERLDVGIFPIHEYWLDIGRVQDLERARKDYI